MRLQTGTQHHCRIISVGGFVPFSQVLPSGEHIRHSTMCGLPGAQQALLIFVSHKCKPCGCSSTILPHNATCIHQGFVDQHAQNRQQKKPQEWCLALARFRGISALVGWFLCQTKLCSELCSACEKQRSPLQVSRRAFCQIYSMVYLVSMGTCISNPGVARHNTFVAANVCFIWSWHAWDAASHFGGHCLLGFTQTACSNSVRESSLRHHTMEPRAVLTYPRHQGRALLSQHHHNFC